MSRYPSSDPHTQPRSSTATQLPPAAFKHRRSYFHSSDVKHTTNHSVHRVSKAYYQLGGLSDGCQTSQLETFAVARRRPPLSQGGKPAVQNLVSSFSPFLQADSSKKAGGTGAATGGTGVFIPVYYTRILSVEDDVLNTINGGMKEGENQTKEYEEEIPIEMLLPSEWTY